MEIRTESFRAQSQAFANIWPIDQPQMVTSLIDCSFYSELIIFYSEEQNFATIHELPDDINFIFFMILSKSKCIFN